MLAEGLRVGTRLQAFGGELGAQGVRRLLRDEAMKGGSPLAAGAMKPRAGTRAKAPITASPPRDAKWRL